MKKVLISLLVGSFIPVALSAMERGDFTAHKNKSRRVGYSSFSKVNMPQPEECFWYPPEEQKEINDVIKLWQKKLDHKAMYGTDESFNALLAQVPESIREEVVFGESKPPLSKQEHAELTRLALFGDEDFDIPSTTIFSKPISNMGKRI